MTKRYGNEDYVKEGVRPEVSETPLIKRHVNVDYEKGLKPEVSETPLTKRYGNEDYVKGGLRPEVS